jgi:hypothetical protein
MGGPSSGGSDNNVSGNEAVYTGGETYSSKKTKTVNKEIADQYIDNRMSGRTDAYGNDISRDGRTGQTKKSIEQPKVASQMDNSEVKSDLIMADKTAPTDVEMTDDERFVATKRGRKTKTILTSITGDNSKATLSKKVLLG